MHKQNSWAANKAALAIVALTLLLVSGAWASTEQILYSFIGTSGASPRAALISDGAGNLYGTAASGGDYKACSSGCGVVFELTPASGGGWTQTVIHTFRREDGANPLARLVFDQAGNLYGTTQLGGRHDDGVVFELIPASGGGWTQKVLHSFYRPYAGELPWAGLAIDAAGNLYGTTLAGYFGVAYQLMPTSSG